MFDDIRLGLRRLVSEPLTSIVAVATLAVGIGANTGVFVLLKDVVFASYPYPQSDRVVYVGTRYTKFDSFDGVSKPLFTDVREVSRSTENMGLFSDRRLHRRVGR